MTQFRLKDANALQMWIKQNRAEIIDAADGCLIDNLVYACKHGTAFFMESYLNPNASEHVITFFQNSETDRPEYLEMWERIEHLQDEAEAC